jgi:hypothetical protein
MKNTTALSPWKQGKAERLFRILKQSMKVNGLKGSSFIEFTHLLQRVEVLVNSRPLGGYEGIYGDCILRPCDFIFPLQTNFLIKLSQELPKEGNRTINEAAAAFEVFREQWSSLYLHSLRKFNIKQSDRHVLQEGDFVILLDRVQQNHEFCCGVISKIITRHHMKVRVISRGMQLDAQFNIKKPAVTVVLDRAPESLIFLSRMGEVNDHFDLSEKKNQGKKKIKEAWSLTPSA